MLKNKTGIITLLLSPVMLIIMGVLLLLIILALFGFAFFITLNAFMLLGILLVIVGSVGLLRGFASNIGFTLIFTGIGLVLLPILSERVAGVTLASVLP